VCACLFAAALTAQSGFDAVSIRPNHSGDGHGGVNMARNNEGAKLTITNTNLLRCLQRAYGVKEYQIAGPDWLKTENYDMIATLSTPTSAAQTWKLMQAVLEERFRIALHRETKTLPVYEPVLAKGGFKIQETEPAGDSGVWDAGRGELTAKKESIENFAEVLSRQMDRPVLDKTDLKGAYDFVLKYDKADDGSIFGALQQQLGLKLEPAKGGVEILVIDHAEKTPTEN